MSNSDDLGSLHAEQRSTDEPLFKIIDEYGTEPRERFELVPPQTGPDQTRRNTDFRPEKEMVNHIDESKLRARLRSSDLHQLRLAVRNMKVGPSSGSTLAKRVIKWAHGYRPPKEGLVGASSPTPIKIDEQPSSSSMVGQEPHLWGSQAVQ